MTGVSLRKTAKGQAEVETRAYRLTPRVRSVLIMVDGRRSLPDLVAQLGIHAEAVVTQLLAEDFIEPIATSVMSAADVLQPASPVTAANVRPVATASAPMPSASAAMAVATRPPAPSVPQRLDPTEAARLLTQRQREAARAVNDLIGPVGDGVALRIERSRTSADLRQALTLGTQVIGNTLGAAAAAKFSQRFLADWP